MTSQTYDPGPVPTEPDYVSAVDRIHAIEWAATFLTQRCADFPAPDRISVAHDITQHDEIDPATRAATVRSFAAQHGAYVQETEYDVSVALVVRTLPIPFVYILRTPKENR